MAMDKLFQLMKDKKASDLFLSVNSPVQLKINGNMIAVNQQKIDNATIRTLLAEVVKPGQMKQLEKTSELNIAIPVVGLGSFRLSAFRQRGSFSAVFRYVACDIPRLAELNVPPALGDVILEKRGLAHRDER